MVSWSARVGLVYMLGWVGSDVVMQMIDVLEYV